MIFNYEFGGEDNFWGGDRYEYEVDYDEIRKALVKILCDGSRDKHRKLYSEDGNYQMAMYVVYELDVIDALTEYYEDDLKDYFEDKARDAFYDR